ncbi:MAG: hypothetical protein A2283_13285 [Lentisphaerae bacterium RIFOXYA12_FULL_48_11]|nr:MAG: hypothetical protein A2283_13285 [Lentisphaerae bacterium RIFOXYA12_FULL_48_11]
MELSDKTNNTVRRTLTLLWALSGFCVLALETIWMREIALRAGNTAVASTLVITVFFAAAALGNFTGARLVQGRKNTLVYYGRFEVASALAAAVTFALNRWLWSNNSVLPESWAGQILAAVLLVGPPSFFSGASFPGLAETYVEDAHHRTSTGGRFYGMNLLGAALGIAAGGVWLPYKLGLAGAFTVAAILQLAGGLIAWRIASIIQTCPPVNRNIGNFLTTPNWLGWTLLVVSGILSLSVQTLLIVWARQVLEGSVYAVCGVLTVFLAGLGAGGLAVAALRRRGRSITDLLAYSSGASGLLLFVMPVVGAWLCGQEIILTAGTLEGLFLQAVLGCGLILLPLTFCLGGVFPVAWELVNTRTISEGRILGTAMAVNKFGAATGTALGLFAIIPLFGLSHGTIVLGWGYLLITFVPLLIAHRLTLKNTACLIIVTAIGLSQTLRHETVLGTTNDEKVLATYAGAYGPVTVVENKTSGSKQILLNSRQRLSGTRRALTAQRMQSWIPLLFCSRPERVVTIGMASGISAAAALDFPIKELHSVELVPEVVTAAHDHFGEWNTKLFSDPRSHVHVADGRVKLEQLPGKFDVITCDLFFPIEDGTAFLYSHDFFESCRTRLNAGGIFCLWLPCYQLTPKTAGIVIHTFSKVFPCAIAVRANIDPLQPVIGLLGANRSIPMSDEFLTARLASPVGQTLAAQSPFFRSVDTVRLLFVTDIHSARPGFDNYELNTDDRPLFAYLGPMQPRGRERLIGFPLLDWIGKRALRPAYPSCDFGTTSPERVLTALRAGNYSYAAAAAAISIPGDTRPASVREQQVNGYLRHAEELWPAARAVAGIPTESKAP